MWFKIFKDSKLKSTKSLWKIEANLAKKYNTPEYVIYNKYSDISSDIMDPVIVNSEYNYSHYKENIINNRNRFIFLKKWSNLLVPDWYDWKFKSMQIWKERWYKVFNVKLWQNCNLGCKYCYLLASNKMYPELAIYWNLEEEVEKFLKNHSEEKILFNIWEHTDSFLFDDVTNYTLFFYSLLDKYPNLVIEARTKLTDLNLLFPSHERFILAFSISINNLDNFWKKELIFKKLDFIKKLTFNWYKIALKFDPIIWINFYDDDFFEKIFSLKIDNIDHYSIWTLRFSTQLKIISEYIYNHKINMSDFELQNWKYVLKNRDQIYNYFIMKLKPLKKEYYLSMEPN